jgi:hypothetical protein
MGWVGLRGMMLRRRRMRVLSEWLLFRGFLGLTFGVHSIRKIMLGLRRVLH